jgi:leucyl-tRNA synthetase
MTATHESTDVRPPAADAEHPHRYTARFANDIEERWQREWEQRGTFITPNPGAPGFDASKPKFYVLDMFPYPSGAGLHVGHPEGYTATDIVARYKRMSGHNVLHPMGWDAFGLPAEQYAVQTGVHPAVTTRQAIDTFRRQLKRFGFSYDWSREFATIDEDYYRWTQWMFLRLYHAWYDVAAKRARPIADLIALFERGEREPRLNPDAAEHGSEAKARAFGPWMSLSKRDRRAIVDSHRLAYLGEQTVNWCPKLGTVLANEEVIDGRSERGGFEVTRAPLRQWMLRITAYADRLAADLEALDWPDSTKAMQREWIGRSEGAEIDFDVETGGSQISDLKSRVCPLRVFTTRPDTVFGATYMVIAPEHPLIDVALREPPHDAERRATQAALREYVHRARNRADVDRMADAKEKTGVFTGLHAINPANGERIPIWTADYVLMSYGHGAIMAVPGHDERDFEFARKFSLPITRVVEPFAPPAAAGAGSEIAANAWSVDDTSRWERPYVDPGNAVNSANAEVSLNGLPTPEAKRRIIDWLERTGRGPRKVNYKLRDWLFSRQRYWGEPFPIVFDAEGDHHPVEESHLPVALPKVADYQPIECGTPAPPLGKATDWVRTTAGEAGVSPAALPPGAPVTRETNTMPNWAGSCWYYLRFCDPKNRDRFVSKEAERYWMGGSAGGGGTGVDLYVGGSEHAVLHLLYARFWHKVLFDLGEVSSSEPMTRLFHQGLIQSHAYQRPDKSLVPIDEVEERAGAFVERASGGPVTPIIAKMSKSLKNVINPDDVIAEYGADTFRLYEMYMGPLEASKPWNTRDIAGPFRFLQRVWRLVIDEKTGAMTLRDDVNDAVERQLHRTIAKVASDIDRLALNTAIAAMMEFVNTATSAGGLTRDQCDRFVRVLAPFAPHAAEELWRRLGHAESIAHAPWPSHDPAMLVDSEVEVGVQIMGKLKARVMVPAEADEKRTETIALADAKVKELLTGKTVKKVIVVKGRLVNIVAS